MIGNPLLARQLLKAERHVVFQDLCAILAGEHEVVVVVRAERREPLLALTTAVLAQYGDGTRVQRYDAPAGLGLSGPNVQHPGVEIDIGPMQRKQLTATQPTQQRDPPQRVQPVVVGRLEAP